MEYAALKDWLTERLLQPLPGISGQERMLSRARAMPAIIPENAKPSAVLILLFPKQDETHILFIKRVEDGRAHSGQIAFPGGKQDKTDADLKATALREAQEEVGLMSEQLAIAGALTTLYIPVSNFNVYPFIAFANEQQSYNINHSEIAYTLEIPLRELMDSDKKIVTDVTSPVVQGVIKNVNAYKFSNDIIVWGATAMILSELETILSDYTKGN